MDRLSLLQQSELRNRAISASSLARADYSGNQIGAAGLTSNSAFITGCNIEFASYGATLCAEMTLIANMAVQRDVQLLAISVRDSAGRCLVPCGTCRQMLFEISGANCLVDDDRQWKLIRELLPNPFT